MTFEPYNFMGSSGDIPEHYDLDNFYVITVNPPGGIQRTFVGVLHPLTWENIPTGCYYAGHSQGGPVHNIDAPTDSVIEGNYTEYRVSGLFETDFKYARFDEDMCP